MIQRTASNKFWHRRKHSVDIDADKLQHEFNSNFAPFVEESNALSDPEAASIPSDSLQTCDALHNQQNDVEEQAAICIQTMFRGFLVLLVLISSCIKPNFCYTFVQFILWKGYQLYFFAMKQWKLSFNCKDQFMSVRQKSRPKESEFFAKKRTIKCGSRISAELKSASLFFCSFLLTSMLQLYFEYIPSALNKLEFLFSFLRWETISWMTFKLQKKGGKTSTQLKEITKCPSNWPKLYLDYSCWKESF